MTETLHFLGILTPTDLSNVGFGFFIILTIFLTFNRNTQHERR